jgi:hypothetical protein
MDDGDIEGGRWTSTRRMPSLESSTTHHPTHMSFNQPDQVEIGLHDTSCRPLSAYPWTNRRRVPKSLAVEELPTDPCSSWSDLRSTLENRVSQASRYRLAARRLEENSPTVCSTRAQGSAAHGAQPLALGAWYRPADAALRDQRPVPPCSMQPKR